LREDDLHLLNASMRWDISNYNLAFTAGVTNLTDEEYVLFANYQDGFGFTQESFHRGREWYLQTTFEF